jgi:DNA-binding response OmpR family regulator
MASVLLIEDDSDLRRLVAQALAAGGHHVESASNAMEALKKVPGGTFDLIILDLGLPDLDGTDLLRMIRAVSAVPVIVATARGADDVVVATLDAGADDYLVKPFSVHQLQARVRAVLRRLDTASGNGALVVGDLVVDGGSREVRLAGELLDLSPKEFDLLKMLIEHKGEVVTKREMLAEVWRQPYGGGDRTVDVHLSWLRKKLGESASEPRYLRTVHGVGVKLVVPEP